jgi:hypothetical protein
MRVDVISMSFVLRLYDKRRLHLETEINKCQDIVMFASTGDLGGNRAPNYPADCANVISISACNREGKEWTYTEPADHWIEGQNLSPGQLNYLLSDELISGSSISTALATGLASVILCCCNIVGEEAMHRGERRTFIKKCFNTLKNPDPRYLRPWLALSIIEDSKERERWDERDGIEKVSMFLNAVKLDAARDGL